MIRIYNHQEIEILRQGGKILAKIMEELKKEVKPGVLTKHLNKVARDLVLSFGAKPSFLGYENFPAVLCTSINEEIVHAVPSERKIKQGDILSLDLGIRFKSYCTDMAITLPILDPADPKGRSPGLLGRPGRTRVGKVNKKITKLIKITEEVLKKGIKQAKPGNHLGDIGYAIQNFVEKNGFQVVRELVGHGLGKKVHEDPRIPNFGKKGTGPKLVKGMVLAIEPMVVTGDWKIEKCEDGFGYKTVDNSLSCHFEHTIAITSKGPEILTQ